MRRVLLIGLSLGALAVHAEMPVTDADLHLGQELFEGKIALRGRIRTHLEDLPPAVIRCGNCHAAAAGPNVRGSQAPRLTRELLLVPHPRRGGPPSIYDRNRFCALLRKGVDPALVLISLAMPTYAIDDADCNALWRFVTGGANAASDP
jgi:hypothetical protein